MSIGPGFRLDATASPAAGPSATQLFDVAVIGGGVNGAGIARDLAGRGMTVLLTEKDDLAQHTSSSSTKLIHGGLRYLEYREFSLVKKALGERERLLKSAPHIMWPLRFVMPHDPSMRPAWMIRAGLFLYDHLAPRELLPPSRTVNLRKHSAGKPLQPRFGKGFIYSDGWVDDARLVVLCAVDAASRGAEVLTHWRCIDAARSATQWTLTLQSELGNERVVRAKALVNAAGPWAAQFLAEHAHAPRAHALRLVKGSHIVVQKLFEHDHAYIFQNPDKRIIFAIPYEREFTLIGTTDVEHHGAIGAAKIDAGEIAYLCAQASRYFTKPVAPADVVWSYSGVRPLLDDESGNPSAVTRDYRLELDREAAPLLSVWGGKITTFRKLAEEVGDMLTEFASSEAASVRRAAWTEAAALPGGDFEAWLVANGRVSSGRARTRVADRLMSFERVVDAFAARQPKWPRPLLRRWVRAYGTRAEVLLEGPLGAEVAPGLHEAELSYLREHEWARSGNDVLWRRSKLGLHLNESERAAVSAWMQARQAEALTAPAAYPAIR